MLKTKVKLEVNDMRYHPEITEEIKEIRTDEILRNSLRNFEFDRKGLLDLFDLI